MIQLSKISIEDRAKWSQKYMRYYRKRTSGFSIIDGSTREKIRKDFMEKHKLTD